METIDIDVDVKFEVHPTGILMKLMKNLWNMNTLTKK